MVICSRSSARRSSDSSVARSLWRARIEGLNTSMRSAPMRLAWYIASSASLSTSSARRGSPSASAIPIEAVRNSSRSLKVMGARSPLRSVSAKLMMRSVSRSDSRMSPNWSPERVLRLQQPPEPPRQRQQNRIADRDANGIVDLLEPVEIDHDHGRFDRGIGLGEGEHALQPVEEELAVG